MTLEDRLKAFPSLSIKKMDEESAEYLAARAQLKPVRVYSLKEHDEMASQRNASAAALHDKYVPPSSVRYEE